MDADVLIPLGTVGQLSTNEVSRTAELNVDL
jgi:hypothetical protein